MNTVCRRLLGTAVAAATLLTGCAAEGPETQPSGLMVNLSPLEVEIFADKKVTLAEYQQAVSATITCLETNGFTILDKQVSPRTGEITFGSSHDSPGPSDPSGNADIDKLMLSCERLSLAVQNVYMLDHLPSVAEREEAVGDARECLVAAGFTVPSPARADVEQALNEVVQIAPTDPRRDAATKCGAAYQAMARTAPVGLAEEWKAYAP